MARMKAQEIEEAIEEQAPPEGAIDFFPMTVAGTGEVATLPADVKSLRDLGLPANAGSLKFYGGYRILIDAAELFFPRDGKKHGVRFLAHLVNGDDQVSEAATFISFSAPVWRTMSIALGNGAAPWAPEGYGLPNRQAEFNPAMLVRVVDQGVTFTIE